MAAPTSPTTTDAVRGPSARPGVSTVQQLIDETYALWLRHAPSLYEFCTTHVLEWPSSTVAWLGDSRRYPPGRDYCVGQVMVSTVSPGTNYVAVYHVFLPAEVDETEYYSDEEMQAFAGYGGFFRDVAPLMQRYCRVVHEGPVVACAAVPQHPTVVATRGRSPFVYLYDLGKRRAEPEDDAVMPDMRLKGHKREGCSLAWSTCREGWLATASADQTVNVYDVNGSIELLGTRDTVDLGPTSVLKGHTDEVEAVSWHGQHDDVLASVGKDRRLLMWDVRAATKPMQDEEVHRAEARSVAFHPTAIFMVATGGADKAVRLWDIRKFRKPLAELVGHTEDVMGLRWAPFNDTVLLSYGFDRTVHCWDVGKCNAPVETKDDCHARPELVFKHVGHTGAVREASWCPFDEDEWVVASVDDNNVLQLWAPNEKIYNDELDDEQYNTEVV